MKITFITGNAGKLREVRQILGAANIEVDSQELDIPEVQGSTREVAIAKCKRAAELLGGPCITEDTALCFQAFNGLPGPYIKYFLKELGHDGLNKMLIGFATTAAWALYGRIVPARGNGQFGWDPVFEAEDTGKTYAEMASEEKNKISHRGRALEKLERYLKGLNSS
ncbi:hypothetical protein BN946_scf184747.g20 [Trametes cinnabarina]|uniref:Inosine triphosphate pyrophosphatase n=1 Tax=Pycnoporus cinnabarinus TaxID=5643 RepID=A0A060SRN4_PYCCI|nr:hypothetical protein BN946_scf184747.g20 [Trametes cinnabarina]